MNPESPTPAPPAKPQIRHATRWNVVWVVPITALLLGTWLLYRNFATRGPVAQISFETAEGIYAGKTEVRCRSVKVGIVKEVKLSADLTSVEVFAELDSDAEPLLREGSRFWVVKPRLSAAEISGLGTLIQGVYIELDPGPSDANSLYQFEGLETPPGTNTSVPGRRLLLTADEANSLQIGAPIYYRGFEVGRIDGRELSKDASHVQYKAFISEKYSHLVTEHTRFWNSSGLEINASTSGVTVRTPSLQSMISGGVSFGLTEGMKPGNPVRDGMTYELFPDKEAARRSTFTPTLKFLLLFDQSVRGLTTSSPVEFRGIPIGRITQISFDLVEHQHDPRIPVLIEIDPTLVRPPNTDITTRPDTIFFIEEVRKGLRAGLKTSNFITGSVHIDFDYHPDAPAANIGKVGQYATFPTVSTSFAQLEVKLNSLIDKLQAVPLQDTMAALNDAAGEAKTMAGAARKTLEDPAMQNLPADLKTTLEELRKSMASLGPDGMIQSEAGQTLEELRATLASLKALADLLEKKPNAIIFGADDEDREPKPRKFELPHRH